MASYKIALESEAKAIGGSSLSVTINKCCTMARASELGCVANTGLYRSNQLVPKDHLSKKVTKYTITFKTISSNASFYLFSTSAIPVGTGVQYFAFMPIGNTATTTHTGSLKVNNPSVQGGTTNVNTGSTIYIKSYSGNWRSVGTFILLKQDQTINVNL